MTMVEGYLQRAQLCRNKVFSVAQIVDLEADERPRVWRR